MIDKSMNSPSSLKPAVPHLLDVAVEIAQHDPRISRCQLHDGRTIVFLTLCAVLCGCNTWNDIADYGKYRKKFLEEYLGPLESVPSHDTIARFFKLLSVSSFEGVYREWINDVVMKRRHDTTSSCKLRQIAIDGKELCGARTSQPVRMVSAFSVEDGVSLGQKRIAEKSNEIPAVQELIAELPIQGSVITADAMHCQKATCKIIKERGGDFLLFAKDNQKKLSDRIRETLDYIISHPKKGECLSDYTEGTHKGDMDVCVRQCVAIGETSILGNIMEDWPWIRSFGVIITELPGKEPFERFFISSMEANAKDLLQVSRGHWAVENNLHWTLDVNFAEDSRRKKDTAAVNFSLITKMAISLLAKDKSKTPMKRKMLKAVLNDDYLRYLLDSCNDNL